MNFLISSDLICLTISSTPLFGINATLKTPSPTAVASDVNDIAGVSDGFDLRKSYASLANSGPIITSGFDANAVSIDVFASDAVS